MVIPRTCMISSCACGLSNKHRAHLHLFPELINLIVHNPANCVRHECYRFLRIETSAAAEGFEGRHSPQPMSKLCQKPVLTVAGRPAVPDRSKVSARGERANTVPQRKGCVPTMLVWTGQGYSHVSSPVPVRQVHCRADGSGAPL